MHTAGRYEIGILLECKCCFNRCHVACLGLRMAPTFQWQCPDCKRDEESILEGMDRLLETGRAEIQDATGKTTVTVEDAVHHFLTKTTQYTALPSLRVALSLLPKPSSGVPLKHSLIKKWKSLTKDPDHETEVLQEFYEDLEY